LQEEYGSLSAAKRVAQAAEVEIACLDSSFQLCASTADARTELAGFANLAQALGTPYIRVFGGPSEAGTLSVQELQTAQAHYDWWREAKAANGWSCDLLLETHDGFSFSQKCEQLLAKIPVFPGVLWDLHHTWRSGKETVTETWSRIGHAVRHIHIKDGNGMPSEHHPYTLTLPGSGEFPFGEAFELLTRESYSGVVSIEWERKWHPYLPPLEEALGRARELGWW
jgi:sugar phosphate isomerase/epimerase